MQSGSRRQDGHAEMRRTLKISAVALAGILLLVLSCADGTVEPPPPRLAPVAATVTVSPASATLTALEETARLTAEVRDQNGQVMAGAAVAWASSDTLVAVVDSEGLVTAVGGGITAVTAAGNVSDAVVSGTAEITVENPDRAALVAFYNATDGPNWTTDDNWLTDAPLGDWYGVETDPSGRVVRLDLAGHWDGDARRWIRHGLSGSIPPELRSHL